MVEPRSLGDLLELEERGQRLEYYFFWGRQPSPSNEVDRSCLSQWWISDFTVDGVTYPTAEHWMMAQKARLFGDQQAFTKIVTTRSPREVKALGRSVRGFDEDAWAAHRFDIVAEGNCEKFRQNPALKDFLLSTSGKILVEASPYDQVWGIGLRANDQRAQRAQRWCGQNLLGFALMRARSIQTRA